jgi:hypothetical protein
MFHRKPGQISPKSHPAQQKLQQTSNTTAPQVKAAHPATLIQRAKAEPSSLSAKEVLALQSAIGNREVSRLLAGRSATKVQAKLTIGQPGDKYEQEADRVASQVVEQIHAPASAQSTQGQSVQRQEESEEEIQAKPSITDIQRSPLSPEVQREAMPEEDELQAKSILQRGEASTDLDAAINSARGGGQPLDAGLQRSMGQAMGADFSGVRVHTDAQSDQLNQSIQAKAFTTGQDVFFRQGAYEPGSRGGQELIAHELTHVVQQNAEATKTPLPSHQLPQHPSAKTPLSSVTNPTIQRTRYIVYRQLPLKKIVNKKDQNSAIKKIKAGLKQKFPLYEGEQREDYKNALLDALIAIGKEGNDVNLFKAHVAGINTSERKRVGNQAKGIAELEKKHMNNNVKWIGAHLVKDAWGGEDNLWNVVAWPQSTEDIWARKFEAPLDLAFQLGKADEAQIEIAVTKEDETWQQGPVHDALDAAINEETWEGREKNQNRLLDKKKLYAEMQVEKVRWNANRAVESVPEIVTARSSATPRFSFGPGDTMWNRARVLALIEIDNAINKVIEALKEGKVNKKALQNASSAEETAVKEGKKRFEEKKEADVKEKKNLSPTEYENDLL